MGIIIIEQVNFVDMRLNRLTWILGKTVPSNYLINTTFAIKVKLQLNQFSNRREVVQIQN